MNFIFFGNCGKPEDLPRLHSLNVPQKIVLMQSLHDQDDAPILLIVQATVKRPIEPVIDCLPLGVGKRLIGL